MSTSSSPTAGSGGRRFPDPWLLGCGLLLIAASVFALHRFGWLENTWSPKVVIFDAEKLFTAKAALVARSSDARPETVQADAATVIAGIKQELRQYQAKGYIVLNASQVMAWPAARDITPEIARNLHIPLPEAP